MGLKRIIDPALEPVSVEHAAAHCRVVDEVDFPILAAEIKAAREWVEARTGRALVTSTWLWSIDRFQDVVRAPAQFYNQWNWNRGRILGNRLANDWYTLFVPRAPLQRVLSITYIDQEGKQQILDPAGYKTDCTTQPGRILPSFGLYWPFSRAEIGAVGITFRAGYGAANTVCAPGSGVPWQPSTLYVSGQLVTPTTQNGHAYVCLLGGVSGSTEPAWTTEGGRVADGGAPALGPAALGPAVRPAICRFLQLAGSVY